MVDDAQEQARALVRAVLDVELLGSVPEALVEDDTFDVARQRGRRIGVGPDVDTERFGRVRIDELGDLFTQLVAEVRSRPRQNPVATIRSASKKSRVNSTVAIASKALHV